MCVSFYDDIFCEALLCRILIGRENSYLLVTVKGQGVLILFIEYYY